MGNKVTPEAQKKECLSRMKMLKIHPNAIKEFRQTGLINASEGGFLYWADEDEMAYVREFEKKHNAMVYHIVRCCVMDCPCICLFYVSNSPDEWEMDRADISNNTPFVYVQNEAEQAFSEFGSIGIVCRFGGIIRVS